MGIGVVLAGVEDETLAVVGLIVPSVLTYAVAVVLYGYLSLTVPALATESKNAPGWIGKPARPTNPVTAFERSVRLIGAAQPGPGGPDLRRPGAGLPGRGHPGGAAAWW